LIPCAFRPAKSNSLIDHSPTGRQLGVGQFFGNGIEVYYEAPRSQWFRQENMFLNEDKPLGNFPGPWDEVLAAAAAR